MINRCNIHIWCGHNTAYINALKMGLSDNNIGLVLTKGAIDSYSILRDNGRTKDGFGCYRGQFILNTAHTELLPGEEYVIEWELFPCRNVEDFYDKIKKHPSYIGISAEHFTVFENEKIKLEIDEKYLTAAEECTRNCLCLFTDGGKGSCAYVYPYRINGEKGQFYDEWAND